MAMGAGGGGGSSGAIRAGRAFVELFLDDTKLGRGLKAAQRNLTAAGVAVAASGVGMVGAGTAALGAFGGLLAKAVSSDKAVADLSDKLGTSAAKLSSFAYAVGLGGEKIGDLEGHLENFAERIYQAKSGAGEAADAFRKLGIGIEGLNKGDVLDVLMRTLDRLQKVGNNDRLGIESSLGGDQFQKLNIALNRYGGMDAIKARMERAKKVGSFTSDDDARNAVRFEAAWSDAYQSILNTVLSVPRAVYGYVGAFERAVEQIVTAGQAVREWVGRNEALIAGAVTAAAAVVALGAAFIATGLGLAAAAAAWGGFMAALAAGQAVIAGAAAVLQSAVLGPIILIPLALAAAGAAFLLFTDTGRGALQGIADSAESTFGPMFDGFLSGLRVVASALKRGDLNTAFEVGTATLGLTWANFLKVMKWAWADVIEAFDVGWAQLMRIITESGLDAYFKRLVALIQRGLGQISKEEYSRISDEISNGFKNRMGRAKAEFEASKAAARDKNFDAKAKATEQTFPEQIAQEKALLIATFREAFAQIGETAKNQKAKSPAGLALAGGVPSPRGIFGGDASALFFGQGATDVPKRQLEKLGEVVKILAAIRDGMNFGLMFGGGN